MTNNEFDFDKIGKRMPYQTPDGFFDQLEEDIWKEVKNDGQEEESVQTVTLKAPSGGRKYAKSRLFMRSVLAVAASIALVLVIHMNFSKQPPVTIHDVDQAFGQLTAADQAYLVNVYQEDVFINE